MSCAQETNALRMISVVIGSAVVELGRALRLRHLRSPLAQALVISDVAVLVERRDVSRRHDGGRALLLDHDRPLVAALAAAASRASAPASRARRRRRRPSRVPSSALGLVRASPRCRRLGGRDPAHRGQSQIDELDRRAGCRVPVADAVSVVERHASICSSEIVAPTRHVDRVLLARRSACRRSARRSGRRRRSPRASSSAAPSASSDAKAPATLVGLAARRAAGRSSEPRRGACPSAASPRRRRCPGSRARSPRRSRAPRRARRRASGRLRRTRRGRTRAGRSPASR